MARTFAGGTDVVTVANNAAIQNLGSANSAMSCAILVKKGTANAFETLVQKGVLGTSGWAVMFDNNGGSSPGCVRVHVEQNASGGDAAVGESSGSVFSNSQLGWIFFSYDQADTQRVRVYTSGLTGALTEVTYGLSNQQGTGAYRVEGSASLTIGNGSNGAAQSTVHTVGLWDVKRTSAQFKDWRDSRLNRAQAIKFQMELSPAGTSVSPEVDQINGLTGTVTGATTTPVSAERPYPITSSDFHDSVATIDKTQYWLASQFSRVRFVTTADTLDLTQYSTFDGGYPDSCAVGVWKDGAFLARSDMASGTILTPLNQYTRNASIALGTAGVSKTIDLVVGNATLSYQTNGLQPALTVPTTIRLTESGVAAAVTITSPSTPATRIYLCQDSLSCLLTNNGFGASNTNNTGAGVQYAWPLKFRQNTSKALLADAWGGHSLQKLTCANVTTYAHDSTTINATVARMTAASPSSVVLILGCNDLGFNLNQSSSWTTTTFQAAYTALLTAIRAALPSASVFVVSPLNNTDATFGPALGAWRTAAQNAASAVSGVSFIDGTTLLGTSYFNDRTGPSIEASDSFHPGATAHGLIATAIRAAGVGGDLFTKALAASLTPSSAVSRRTSRALSASLTPSSFVSKRPARSLAASLTTSTTLAGIKTATKALAASVTPSATMANRTSKALAASVTPAGTVAKRTARSLAASLTASATVAGSIVAASALGLVTAVITWIAAVSSAITHRTDD